jgi:hypothetical protein
LDTCIALFQAEVERKIAPALIIFFLFRGSSPPTRPGESRNRSSHRNRLNMPSAKSGKILAATQTDFDGKGLRRFLRQILTDALDDSVRAFARELLGIGCSVRGRCNAIGITIKGYHGHGDDGTFGKSLFQIVVLRVAFSEAQWPGRRSQRCAVKLAFDLLIGRIARGRSLHEPAADGRAMQEFPLCGGYPI